MPRNGPALGRWVAVLAVVMMAMVGLVWWLGPAEVEDPAPPPTPDEAMSSTRPACSEAFVTETAFLGAARQSSALAEAPIGSNLRFRALAVAGGGQSLGVAWQIDGRPLQRHDVLLAADRQWVEVELPAALLDGPSDRRVTVTAGFGDCEPQTRHIAVTDTAQSGASPRAGWMRPSRALEVLLAQQADTALPGDGGRSFIDDLDDSGEPLLVAAILRGDTPGALTLIRRTTMTDAQRRSADPAQLARYAMMANPFVRGRDGRSPLELALSLGQDEVVSALIESALNGGPGRQSRPGDWGDSQLASLVIGDNAQLRFADGDTALLRAARTGNERAVLTLARLEGWQPDQPPAAPRVDLFAWDAAGKQAPTVAREAGHNGVVALLDIAWRSYTPKWAVARAAVAMGIDNDMPRECRKTAFEDEREFQFMADIWHLPGREVRHRWLYDRSVLHETIFALSAPRQITVSSLAINADQTGQWQLEVVDESNRVMATRRLHYQALTDYNRKNRAKFNAPCSLGGSALLTLTTAHAPLSELEALLAGGAELQPGSARARQVLARAVESGSITHVRWLLDRGLDINAGLGDSHRPALLMAAESGDRAMLGFLLRRGADTAAALYRNGRTALHAAALNNDPAVIRDLLAAGAQVDVFDGQQHTALHLAAGRCLAASAAQLLAAGADPLVVDRKGQNARDLAASCTANESWQASAGLDLLRQP